MHKAIGYVLLGLECLWIIGWIVLTGFGQAATDITSTMYRMAITFLVFHSIGNITALLYVLENFEKSHKMPRWLISFLFLFGVAVDVNLLVETILHLSRVSLLWYGMIVLSSVGLGLSAVSFVWFLSLRYRVRHTSSFPESDSVTLLEPPAHSSTRRNHRLRNTPFYE